VLVHGLFRRFDAEVSRDVTHGAPIRQTGRDVRPLARIGALGEEAAKLVQRPRRRAQDPMSVLVDEADRAQYFEK
jgi:hypothetical protein